MDTCNLQNWLKYITVSPSLDFQLYIIQYNSMVQIMMWVPQYFSFFWTGHHRDMKITKNNSAFSLSLLALSELKSYGFS
jgi:hypothetical protein